MIAILEADIGGVDIGRRRQGAIEQIAALFGAKIAGISGRHLGEKAQRALGALNQILGAFNAGLARLRDRITEDRHDRGRILVVIVNQDEDEYRNAQADEEHRHDHAHPRAPHRPNQRKRAQPGQQAVQDAAPATRPPDHGRNRDPGQDEQRRGQPAPHAAVISVPDQRLGQLGVS
jgi:hypothetical protein